MDLPQVGGELRLLVAAARHIGVRVHHVTPRLQVARRRRFDERAASAPLLTTGLLVDDEPAQLCAHAGDLVGLRCRDGREEAGRRVEGALRVVAGEAVLVRPLVPPVAQLAHDRALGLAEGLPEHVVPGVDHEGEQRGAVPIGEWAVRREAAVLVEVAASARHALARTMQALELALDEWAEALLEEVHRFADALVIGDRHLVLPRRRYSTAIPRRSNSPTTYSLTAAAVVAACSASAAVGSAHGPG